MLVLGEPRIFYSYDNLEKLNPVHIIYWDYLPPARQKMANKFRCIEKGENERNIYPSETTETTAG